MTLHEFTITFADQLFWLCFSVILFAIAAITCAIFWQLQWRRQFNTSLELGDLLKQERQKVEHCREQYNKLKEAKFTASSIRSKINPETILACRTCG